VVLHGSGMSGKAVARVIGPIPSHLDATGILLEMVTAGS
jgi:hypothetical protein